VDETARAKRILIDHGRDLRLVRDGGGRLILGLFIVFEYLVELIDVDLPERRTSSVLGHGAADGLANAKNETDFRTRSRLCDGNGGPDDDAITDAVSIRLL